jgi:hypothetical protein
MKNEILEKLAEQLGTTTEYLWGILLKQAPIAATMEVIFTLITIIMGVALFRMNKYLSNDDNKVNYDTHEFMYAPIIIGAIVFIVCAIGSLTCFDIIVNGYFHPEYWALEKIINSLK